ncbi:hypothetical protein RJT34_12955 [Clitoria ternatea]|uniref:Uncharacterized protein n=1 Tax=Clitoria ternatea TaxID=43366 RepID=A0AAN9PL02_CLITE
MRRALLALKQNPNLVSLAETLKPPFLPHSHRSFLSLSFPTINSSPFLIRRAFAPKSIHSLPLLLDSLPSPHAFLPHLQGYIVEIL